MGYTFKENCSDTRNTKVSEIIKYFKKETGSYLWSMGRKMKKLSIFKRN